MRPSLAFAAIAVVLAASGCADGDRASAPAETVRFPDGVYYPEASYFASAMMRNAILECRNKRLSGELKNFVESADCSNRIITGVYSDINYPYMDLIRTVTVARRAASARVDRGEWTEAQAQDEMSSLGQRINTEIARRDSSTVERNTQTAATPSPAALLPALGLEGSPTRPEPAPEPA